MANIGKHVWLILDTSCMADIGHTCMADIGHIGMANIGKHVWLILDTRMVDIGHIYG